MLRIFKQNDISSAFMLLILGFVLKFNYILHPPRIADIEHFERGLFFTLKPLYGFYQHHASWYVFFSVCLLIIFAYYFNYVIIREKFLQKKSYIPALSFLLFSSFAPALNVFSTAFIANVFVFIAFSKMMQLYHVANPRRVCFDVGMIVSIASLFYFPSVLFFVLLIALLLLLRPFVLQENIAYMLGIITPFYFCISILYLRGHWNSSLHSVFLNLTLPMKTMSVGPLVVMTIISISMLVYGLFLVNQAGAKNAISVRKKWNGVVLYVFFAAISGLFSSLFPGIPWIITITPISILLSTTFLNHNERINSIMFYFLIITILVIQWMF